MYNDLGKYIKPMYSNELNEIKDKLIVYQCIDWSVTCENCIEHFYEICQKGDKFFDLLIQKDRH